jgi:hypothetical protein
MANNTVTVEAATVDASDTDTTQSQADMGECLQAISTMGDIHNQASELASKLYAETDDAKRKELISTSNKAVLGTLAGLVLCHLELKNDSNAEIGKLMPELARLSTLQQIEKVDRSIIADLARQLARHQTRMLDEQLGSYASAGPVYAGMPIGVDFGLELGVVTGEGADLQRSGLVVGLRLDHLTGAKPARRLGIPKAKG